jgi:diguanylate cyclase (GGDEF)-like protein/PAS domain S-box-containing protein
VDIRQRFFDGWHDALVVYDRDLRILGANAAAARLFGCELDELTGSRNGDHGRRAGDSLDPLIESVFINAVPITERVTPFGPKDEVSLYASLAGDEALVVLHRLSDASFSDDTKERELDLATQLLTFHTDHSPLAVIRWDAQMRIVGWSPRAEAIFGWKFLDVYGKSIDEVGLVYDPDREIVARVAAEIQSGAVAGNNCENRNLTRDCRVIHCRWFNSHVKLGDGFGVLSLVEDITDAVLARTAASESEQRFRSIFDYSPDPIFALQLDGTIARVNASASMSQAASIEEMIGRPVTDFIAEFDRDRARKALAEASRGAASTGELMALRHEDHYPISASFIPIVLEGRVRGVHLVMRDLTGVRRAEQAIATQGERIRELYLVSATEGATAERQIAATLEAGCRLLGMASGTIYEAHGEKVVAHSGPPTHGRLSQLALGTDTALAMHDIYNITYATETDLTGIGIGSYISTPIDVGGGRFGTLSFADTNARSEDFAAVDGDLVALMGALVGSAIERGRAGSRLNDLAYNDQLTALPNRSSFVEQLTQEMSRSTARGTRIAIMFLDLDRFKDINDTLGHAIGDRVLQTIGSRLQTIIAGEGRVARMGGDEFILMFSDDPSLDWLASVAERIVERVDEPVEIDGYEQFVTTSIGIALFPDHGLDADTLIKHADVAMYRAKERGRNTYQFFTPELNASLRLRLSQEKSLRRALENEEFVVYYQPQIELSTGRLVCLEALVRWVNPTLGLVPPNDFIPSAELSGLIVPLGDWILETACRQVAQWQRSGHPDLRLAVNLSARQFHQNKLADKVRTMVENSGIAPGSLELEITESVAMNEAQQSVTIMEQLRDSGIRLSVDDFGTGYSSLGYLRRFPLHSVKIDQSFVRDIMTEPDDATIVRTVIGMAHSLGLEVVAEGVENVDQLSFLEALHCDRVQGYYFARPASAAALAPFLEKFERVPAWSGVNVGK